MCKAFSGIIKLNGDVIWKFGEDSHEKLISTAGLKDNTADPGRMRFARFEITPNNGNYLAPDKWRFQIDEKITPTWFDTGYEKICWEEFRKWKRILNRKLVKKTMVGPFSVKPPKKITKKHIDLFRQIDTPPLSELGTYRFCSLLEKEVGYSVTVAIVESAWSFPEFQKILGEPGGSYPLFYCFVWEYAGSFFKLSPKAWEGTGITPGNGYPFQPSVDLWEMGLVPTYDGKHWRLHGGPDGKVLWEGKI